MSLIIDPDLLADSAADDASQEVYVSTSAKTIKLVIVGNLSTDGVTLKCLYSFLKEQWRSDPNAKNLAAFPFPMVPITDESFEFVDGWDFVADASRYLIRTGGWTVRNASGNVTQKWAGVVGLGTIESDDQLYFQQASGGAAANVQLTGQVNQAVSVLSDPNGDGNFADGYDRRTFFKLFAREYQQAYDDANLVDIGVTTMDSIVYRFPIGTASDALKITHADATVSTTSPYTEIKVRFFSGSFTKKVDSQVTARDFGIVIDVGTHSGIDGSVAAAGSVLTSTEGGIPTDATYTGGTLIVHEGASAGSYPISGTPTATQVTITGTFPANGSTLSFTLHRASDVIATAEQIYEKVQYQLRQNSDIDSTSASVTGKTADLLLRFVGDTLECGTLNPTNPNGGGSGVIIEGFQSSDTNRLTFRDNSASNRTYPFVAVLTLQFGSNLQLDASAKYWVYFTTLPGANNDYGESGALLVEDNSAADMAGNVGGVPSIQRTFDYDNNVQGGRTPATDAGVTVIGIGLATGQYVRATGTIARSTSNVVSLSAALERNYANP